MLDSDKTSHPRIIFWRSVRQLWLVLFFDIFIIVDMLRALKWLTTALF